VPAADIRNTLGITMSRGSPQPASDVNRRPYNAPRRAAKAAETRRKIVAAAHELFVTQGYHRTTVDEVAALAGVSRPTVFVSIGGKPELLKLVRDFAIAGDDSAVAIPQRDMFLEVWNEPDPRRTLALFARNMRRIHRRVAEVEHVLQAAAQTDPDLTQLAETALQQRRYGCGLLARSLASKTGLRDGLTVEIAADAAYAVASPDVCRLLTRTCSWSPRRYEMWLAGSLQRELLAPPRADRP
jgi:AcrR family transcriptional regulator